MSEPVPQEIWQALPHHCAPHPHALSRNATESDDEEEANVEDPDNDTTMEDSRSDCDSDGEQLEQELHRINQIRYGKGTGFESDDAVVDVTQPKVSLSLPAQASLRHPIPCSEGAKLERQLEITQVSEQATRAMKLQLSLNCKVTIHGCRRRLTSTAAALKSTRDYLVGECVLNAGVLRTYALQQRCKCTAAADANRRA